MEGRFYEELDKAEESRITDNDFLPDIKKLREDSIKYYESRTTREEVIEPESSWMARIALLESGIGVLHPSLVTASLLMHNLALQYLWTHTLHID